MGPHMNNENIAEDITSSFLQLRQHSSNVNIAKDITST